MTTSKATKPEETTLPGDSTAAFAFVSELAKEVSSGKVELPSFPDVAVRVRKVLADEAVANEQIARIVGSDAGLAARVLTLANSAALNRAGRAVADLKTAINRIGHNNVRTAAVSFAIAQLRRASELRNIAQDLERVWQEATLVAALAYLDRQPLPGQCRRVDACRPAAQRRQALHPGARQPPRTSVPRSGRDGAGAARLARQRRQGDRRELGSSPSTSPRRSASTRTSTA